MSQRERQRLGRLEGGRETAEQEGGGRGRSEEAAFLGNEEVAGALQSSRGRGRRAEAGSQRLHPPITLGSHPPPSFLSPPASSPN